MSQVTPIAPAVERRPLLDATTVRLLQGIALAGALTVTAGVFIAPVRALTAVLIAAFFFLSVALAGPVFLALMTVSNAGWHTVLKRVPEAMGQYLPVGALVLLAVLPGVTLLYPWAQPGAEHDHLLHEKHAFLNVPGFALRMVAMLALWTLFAWALRRRSVLQDADGDVRHTARSKALSAVFLIVFALTFCLASFDWLMSLEPHWFSTIFGLYNIGGLLAAGTAVITVLVVALRRAGPLAQVTDAHLHDLGKLLFGFATLWAYLWLSQYLLIWYANIPEETSYYLTRSSGGWSFLFWMNLGLSWLLPFLMLLPRAAKRSETNLLWASGFLLAGRFLDLYLMAAPGGSPEHTGLGVIELGAFAGTAAIFLLVVTRAFGSAASVARGDPYLVESLHHHG